MTWNTRYASGYIPAGFSELNPFCTYKILLPSCWNQNSRRIRRIFQKLQQKRGLGLRWNENAYTREEEVEEEKRCTLLNTFFSSNTTPPVCMSIPLSVRLSVRLSACPPVCPPVRRLFRRTCIYNDTVLVSETSLDYFFLGSRIQNNISK